MFYVHLGAGAGDLDERADFRCGFTEFIKKNYSENSKVFVVEANPKNIEKLNKSYKNYNNVKILNLAISSNNDDELILYYAEEDSPHYQVCSSNINHVKKHYPSSLIKKFYIESISINDLFKKYSINQIDYLSIDIEGLDYDVLMSIDFTKFSIDNICIEFLHLTKFQKKNLINFLSKKGYSYYGYGYDHNNFDYLFIKKKNYWNEFLSKALPYISTKHYKILNFLLIR